MYEDKNLLYIFTMLECIEKIWIYTAEFQDAQEFVWAQKQLPYNAVINLFIAIGEESKKIDTSLKENLTKEFSWKEVAGIRDKLAHDYRGVNEQVLWNTIHNELSTLKEALLKIYDTIKPPFELLQEVLASVYYEDIQYLLERK